MIFGFITDGTDGAGVDLVVFRVGFHKADEDEADLALGLPMRRPILADCCTASRCGSLKGMTTTVTESNQVSIPPDIAREFDIQTGTRLEWAKTGEGVITVKPLPGRGELARQLMGAGRHLLKPGADPIGDLIREREQDDQLDQADNRR